jgi:hypothetical protein
MEKPIFEFHPPMHGVEWGIPVNVPKGATLGLYLLSGPTALGSAELASNQAIAVNFTGPAGTASAIYFAMIDQLIKWGYNIEKPDEWIEVSPAHREWYEKTMATKQMLEGVIKPGLASAAAAVADYELVAHDLRKYREMMNYFEARDEHSLKAMFIQQVDVHTGPHSIIEMSPRWPTLQADFMRLGPEVGVSEIQKKYEVSKAEAVVLSTKNRLYKQWKKLFFDAVKSRYEMLSGLVAARKKSIAEYREWLKPYIARFKMTRLGVERPAVRRATLRSFAEITGMAVFSNGIRIWAWKFLKPLEVRAAPAVIPPEREFVVHPYDDFIRERFVLSKTEGLAKEYPWLLDERRYCPRCKRYHKATAVRCEKCGSLALELKYAADEIVEKEIIPDWKAGKRSLRTAEPYYIFFDIDIMRLGSKLPVGELEDITFNIRTYVLSQNVLLLKLLELVCRERELDRYIDELLGIKLREEEVVEIVRREYPRLLGPPPRPPTAMEAALKSLRESAKKLKVKVPRVRLPIMFVKPGPYERDFYERITKQYLKPSGELFAALVSFLEERMGVR